MRRYSWQLVMLFILLLCAAAPGAAAAKARTLVASSAADGPRSLSLVVYNQDLALVREVRTVTRKEGLFELCFQDVARELVPNSVLVDTGEELKVLEQCYTYDLLSAGSLLEHFIGKTVILERLDKRTDTPEQVEGTLLSLEGGRIVRIGDRVEVDPEGRFILPEVPANLTDRPTLTWLVRGKNAGQSKVEVSYLTGGMGWRCDYVLSLAGDSDAGLSAWVTLDNRSGLDYPDCELTLVAGEISRVSRERPMVELMAVRAAGMPKAADEPRQEGFLREQLQDYYRYTLGRRTDIDNKQSKQVELFGLNRVKVERRYSLAGGRDFFYGRVAEPSRDLKVAMYLDWINGGGNYPGMPLPAGLVRIYRHEPDGTMFFLGEDRIGHVPQEEKVSIRAGNAFDLTAERRQTEFTKLSDRLRQATVEITLTNRKKQDVAVEVEENLPGDWTMLEHSHEYLTIDAGRIRFSPRVRAGGKTTVKYTIKFM